MRSWIIVSEWVPQQNEIEEELNVFEVNLGEKFALALEESSTISKLIIYTAFVSSNGVLL